MIGKHGGVGQRVNLTRYAMSGPQLGEHLVSGSALAAFRFFQPFLDCRANLGIFRIGLV